MSYLFDEEMHDREISAEQNRINVLQKCLNIQKQSWAERKKDAPELALLKCYLKGKTGNTGLTASFDIEFEPAQQGAKAIFTVHKQAIFVPQFAYGSAPSVISPEKHFYVFNGSKYYDDKASSYGDGEQMMKDLEWIAKEFNAGIVEAPHTRPLHPMLSDKEAHRYGVSNIRGLVQCLSDTVYTVSVELTKENLKMMQEAVDHWSGKNPPTPTPAPVLRRRGRPTNAERLAALRETQERSI